MIASPTATDIVHGLNVSALSGLTTEQRRVVVTLMARAAERAYRRGVQQGAHFAVNDRIARPLHDWRYQPSVDASPDVDSNRVEPALERLHAENPGLALLGFPAEAAKVGQINVDDMVERVRVAAATYQQIYAATDRDDNFALALASADIRSIGIEIHTLGGSQAMLDVYDELTERHGHEATRGVTNAWTLIGGWSA